MISNFSRKWIIIFTLFCVVSLCFSIWLGAKSRIYLSSLNNVLLDASSDIERVLHEVEVTNIESVTAYNKSVLKYRQKDYSGSETFLRASLNASDGDGSTVEKARFNLGNSLYRQAEKENDPQRAVNLLSESVMLYRAILSRQKSEVERSERTDVDSDIIHNYLVARQRLKVIMDELKQRKNEDQNKISLYAQVVDLLEAEKKIKENLHDLANRQELSIRQKSTLKASLLEMRRQNAEKLKAIERRLREMTNGGQPSTQNAANPQLASPI